MSDPVDLPDDDALAGEYVLGVLTGDGMARCAERRLREPAFDQLVTEWEARLMPMTSLVAPVSPPPQLRPQIEASMRPVATSNVALPQGLRRQLWTWRAIAGISLMATCMLGFFVLTRPVPPAQVVAVLLPPGNGAGGFLVRDLAGSIRLEPVRSPAVPPGRDLELWSLPAGSTVPRSLGVLPSDGEILPAGTLPEEGVQLLVSIEPAGGSPTGAPTGPVVLAAELPRKR